MEPKRINRYLYKDLAFFKEKIDSKLAKATKDLNHLLEQLEDTTEAIKTEGDWQDDTSNNINLELLQTMIRRQRKHIHDLENALIRIKNKNYGICVITGHLIDKRRLLAVPTTTKSIAAKIDQTKP